MRINIMVKAENGVEFTDVLIVDRGKLWEEFDGDIPAYVKAEGEVMGDWRIVDKAVVVDAGPLSDDCPVPFGAVVDVVRSGSDFIGDGMGNLWVCRTADGVEHELLLDELDFESLRG